MNIFKLVIATASLLIITTASATQKIKPDAIDKIVLAEMKRQFSPGVAISKKAHVRLTRVLRPIKCKRSKAKVFVDFLIALKHLAPH